MTLADNTALGITLTFCICSHVASINHFIIIATIRCRSHRS